MTKLNKLTKFSIGLTVLLLLLQIAAANRLTTAGITLSELASEKAQLEQSNQFLTVKIASYSSLLYTTLAMERAGFGKPAVLHLKRSVGVALKTDVAY